jgi:glucosamine 6-phosphate synthetase-like amidotransferase/phosphosugar isomerase protein
MCGIIGLLPFGKLDAKQERIRQEIMIYLSTELLQLTQTRGKDATGVCVMFENCEYIGLKMGISAVEFVSRFGGKETDFEGFIKIWRKKPTPAKVFLGHCRKPTAGKSAIDNMNNHPIEVGDIIGIHNGTIDNHEIIFENLKRKPNGDVDSEAIFQLLHYLTNNGADPFTLDVLNETCKRLEGSYACLAFNDNNPFQVVAFRDSRPIEIALLRPLKLAIIASDSDFIKTALFRLNIMANIYNYGVNFPTIHKSDIDMELLSDDSVYLFDLTKEIGINTSVTSIYESKRVIRTEKIWKNKKDSYSGYYNQNTYKQNRIAIEQRTAEVTVSSAESPDDDQDEDFEEDIHDLHSNKIDKQSFEKALVWNKFSKSFEKADVSLLIEKEVTKKLSNIIMNIETDSVVTIDEKVIRMPKCVDDEDDKGSADFSINEDQTVITKKDNNNVAEIEVVKTIPANLTERQRGESVKGEFGKDSVSKRQVNMITLSPVAIELATEAMNSAERFSTNDDVCQALNLHNCDNLNSIPAYSLANRIIKYITEKAFLVGWEAAIQDSILINTIYNKQEKAEQGIRTSKILINFISKIILAKKIQLFGNKSDEQTTKIFWKDKNFSLKMMQKIFSPKEFKQNEILDQIQTFLTNKEKKIVVGG